MSQRNSLMEWMAQTKRVTKEEDYMGLAIIDTIENSIPFIHPRLLHKNRQFIDKLCEEYHKINPIEVAKTKTSDTEKIPPACLILLRDAVTEQIQIQIDRYHKARNVIVIQWCEIVDFLWERPELVNPASLDDYIIKTINDVCMETKKKNPLIKTMMARFGKFWKDKEGRWRVERRKRF